MPGETEDGNFYFVDPTSWADPDDDYQLNFLTTLRNVSSAGEMSWFREYPSVYCESVIQTSDGGYALAGTYFDPAYYPFTIYSDLILIKTNSVGDTLWTHIYKNEGHAEVSSLQQTSDGGYIIAGLYQSQDISVEVPHASVIKTDAAGDTLWTKRYDALGMPGYLQVCEQSGGYIMSSDRLVQSSPWGGPDSVFMQITKLDTDGNIQWTREFEGGKGMGNNVAETSDGGFLLTGTAVYPHYSAGDIILIKLDSIGNFVVSTAFPEVGKSGDISVYPNPASDVLTFTLDQPEKAIQEISIYNIAGQKIKQIGSQITHGAQIDINDLSSGMYFYEVTSGDRARYSGKFVVDK